MRSKRSIGEVGWAAIGAALVLIVLCVVCCFCLRRRRAKQRRTGVPTSSFRDLWLSLPRTSSKPIHVTTPAEVSLSAIGGGYSGGYHDACAPLPVVHIPHPLAAPPLAATPAVRQSTNRSFSFSSLPYRTFSRAAGWRGGATTVQAVACTTAPSSRTRATTAAGPVVGSESVTVIQHSDPFPAGPTPDEEEVSSRMASFVAAAAADGENKTAPPMAASPVGYEEVAGAGNRVFIDGVDYNNMMRI